MPKGGAQSWPRWPEPASECSPTNRDSRWSGRRLVVTDERPSRSAAAACSRGFAPTFGRRSRQPRCRRVLCDERRCRASARGTGPPRRTRETRPALSRGCQQRARRPCAQAERLRRRRALAHGGTPAGILDPSRFPRGPPSARASRQAQHRGSDDRAEQTRSGRGALHSARPSRSRRVLRSAQAHRPNSRTSRARRSNGSAWPRRPRRRPVPTGPQLRERDASTRIDPGRSAEKQGELHKHSAILRCLWTDARKIRSEGRDGAGYSDRAWLRPLSDPSSLPTASPTAGAAR